MHKTIGIILLSIYIALLGFCAAAEFSYQTGMAQKDAGRLKLACMLNPFVSDYRQEFFEQSEPKDMQSIEMAIRLEPLGPA